MQLTVGSLVWRAIFSGLLVLAYGLVNGLIYPITTIASGKLAGGQFASSDIETVKSLYAINFLGHVGWPFIVLLALLLWVWWRPLRTMAEYVFWPIGAVVLALIWSAPPASAYYNKTDWPEWVYILPNESAFYIPDLGENKDSQAQFMSQAYLAERKIAAKRFQIPHTKVQGSSYTFDYYGPAGRLIIVDRTPYAREWTSTTDGTRGTSVNNEAMQCQSSEGIDIKIEIALSASVFEENATLFLFRFGVKPPAGDRNLDEVKFASVYHGKSLTEVMDTVIHGKVQTLFCAGFGDKTLDQINAQMTQLVIGAETATKIYLLKEFGITLDYLGLAGSPDFAVKIQGAIDDRYVADKVSTVLATLERQAAIRIQEAQAAALRAFGEGIKAHGLPSNMLLLPAGGLGGGDLTSALASGAAAAAGIVPAPVKPTGPRVLTPAQ